MVRRTRTKCNGNLDHTHLQQRREAHEHITDHGERRPRLDARVNFLEERQVNAVELPQVRGAYVRRRGGWRDGTGRRVQT